MKCIKSNKFNQLSGKLLLRILPTLVVVLFASGLYSQGFNQKYDVHLIGQVTALETGAPIKEHAVHIETDTLAEPGFYYSNTVYTDHEGYFYDTVLTNLEKGSLVVTTYDFEENRYDTVVHYRFRWEEINILFANLAIKTQTGSGSTVQANFSYVRNPSGANSLEYQFIDLTNSNDVLSWVWSFGDGSFTNEQNPVHSYEEAGLYKVVLTVCYQTGAINQVSSITKIINVSDETYFHMGGHVFAGSFPIDKSEVFLYKIEDDELIPIDTAIFNDTLGYYLFYQLIEGDYIVKADLHPTSELFNMFMTTYYSDKLHWDEADTIHHHTSNYEYDINLVANSYTAASGPGCIEGVIGYDPSYYGGDKSAPAENVSILLYDEFDQPITICHSDEDGLFALDNLDLDKYFVYAEVTGKYTFPVEAMLEPSNSGALTVQILINEDYVSGAVNLSVDENILDSEMSDVFPNPVLNSIRLRYSGQESGILSYEILNYNGQLLQAGSLTTHPGSASVEVPASMLHSGIYFIRLTDSSGRIASRKFIKK